jgi:hypothetical protein
MENGKIDNINIMNPLLIRKFDDKNLFIISKKGINTYEYKIFTLCDNSTSIITMLSINMDDEYIPFNTKIIRLNQVIIIITKFENIKCNGNKFWITFIISLSKDEYNNIIFNQYLTESKPININNKYLIMLIDNKPIIFDLLNNKIDENSFIHQNDDVSYITKNKATSFVMFGLRSGKCLLHQISTFFTLKECLFISELEKCKNSKTILDY